MNWNKLLNNNRLRQATPRNSEDARNDFESDLGRIIFSPAIRRMHDKTQVFPLTTDDNIHSRLTHSMEVMSVGYSLGVKLCESEVMKGKLEKNLYELFREIPVIMKNCCLVHDIGNPPFGHFGETVIQNYFREFFKQNIVRKEGNFTQDEINSGKVCIKLDENEKKDFIEFDGNAQGLRVLTKLQILNDVFGLNLTYATLASYIKYPNYGTLDDRIIEKSKHGIFVSERAYFQTIAEECGLIRGDRVIRHPLSYLMEAADSICYLTMDIEDGYNKGLVSLDYLYEKLKDIPSLNEKIEKIYSDPDKYYKNEVTKMVNFRIQVIQTLVILAIKNFENNIDKIENGNYNTELIFDDNENKLAKTLKDISGEKIFTYRDINSLEVTGHSVIAGILNFYIKLIFHSDKKYKKRAKALLSHSIVRAALEENGLTGPDAKIDDLPDYYKLRIIVDFVSGMTDQFAVNHYQKLSGQKII